MEAAFWCSYGMKAALKVSAQGVQRGGVNKTSAESTAQDDDFQVIKRHKKAYR
jgi:NAD(P)H-dependent flavin oxidoreductase YrpB (nitropropane dioxygenase family)